MKIFLLFFIFFFLTPALKIQPFCLVVHKHKNLICGVSIHHFSFDNFGKIPQPFSKIHSLNAFPNHLPLILSPPITFDIFPPLPSYISTNNIPYTSVNQSNIWSRLSYSSPPLRYAIELGQKVHQTLMKDDQYNPLILLQAQELIHSKKRDSSGVAVGFIVAAVLEGLSPPAFKQASQKLNQLMDKYLVPPLEDLMGGAPRGGQAKQQSGSGGGGGSSGGAVNPKGESGLAQDYGAMSIIMSTDLIGSTPMIAATYSEIFSSLLTQNLYHQLIERLREPLTQDLSQSLLNILSQSLPTILPQVIPPALERYLPKAVGSLSSRHLVQKVTRAVTHILGHSLSHTLTSSLYSHIYCYYCQYYHQYCKYCQHLPDYIINYYSHYYQSILSDYYSTSSSK